MSHGHRVGLVVSRAYETLVPDSTLVRDAFADAGFDVSTVRWDDEDAPWKHHDALLIRQPWDYFERPAAFRAWIDAVEDAGVPLFNAPSVLRWNMHKAYLRDLEAQGLPVVPTEWIPNGADIDLAALLEARRWDRAVVKPAISAGAWRTWVTTRAEAPGHQAALADVLEDGEAMLQPFLPQIEDEGEWSLVFFAGRFSHAVLKRPAAGDFRVQERHGGSTVALEPPPGFVAQAEAVAAACPEPALYARVDGVRDGDRLVVIELEVLEPVLYVTHDPASPARLVESLHTALHA